MKLMVSILVGVMILVSNSINAQKQTITASVVNVTSNDGKVAFALYNKTNFMAMPLQAKNGKIVDGVSTVIFENIEAGEYAIICYHDKNDNDRMDFQENGMPLEDYGASNNVVSFGPPQYDDSKFMVTDKKVNLEIKF